MNSEIVFYPTLTYSGLMKDALSKFSDIYKLSVNRNNRERLKAVDDICDNASQFSSTDQVQALQILIRLAHDECRQVREKALGAIGNISSQLSNKDQAQAWTILFRMCQDKDWEVRGKAAEAIGNAYTQLPDKDQAYQVLLRLIQDHSGARWNALDAICNIFFQISDEDQAQAWQFLLSKAQDNRDWHMQERALDAICNTATQFSDKDLALQILLKLSQDKDRMVKGKAVVAICNIATQISDQDQACRAIRRLAHDEDWWVRETAINAIGNISSQLSDKNQAWKVLLRLMVQEETWAVREKAADSICDSICNTASKFSDKDQTCQILLRLAKDKNDYVRKKAIGAIGIIFSQLPDKDQVFQFLLNLISQDVLWEVRQVAVDAICGAASQIPDKDQAWEVLLWLSQDIDKYTRRKAAIAIGNTFSQLPDKDKACQVLIILIQDKDSEVRWRAADAICDTAPQISDKEQAWQLLFRMAQDRDSYVRQRAADAIGNTFSQLPDKDLAWQVLLNLSQDKNGIVSMIAYHSLGRASVFKAIGTKNREALKNELESAITYFEISSQEPDSPARFCYPFYRSYMAITFKEAKDDEVQRYLKKAKKAVGGSESKDELLKAVGNLAKALQKSQSLKNRPVEEVANELDAYRLYCEKAAGHMKTAEDKAPGAVRLMRKCNPIVEERIDSIIAEIQEKAKHICQKTRGSGTTYEAPGVEINEAAKALSSTDIESMQRCSARIVDQLWKFCKLLPEEQKGTICEVVNEIVLEADLPERLTKIELALSYLNPIIEGNFKSPSEKEILKILKIIEFNTSKLSIRSGDTKQGLFQIHSDIKNLKDIIEGQGRSINQIGETLIEIDKAEVERLEKIRKDLLSNLEIIMVQDHLNDEKFQDLLGKVRQMMKMEITDYSSILADIIQIGSYLNWLFAFSTH
jgi:HEAT repeat protein